MDVRAPQTQKAEERPISFVLDDQSTGAPLVSISLVIRPEDLTRNNPSRMTVQQTLGGAWADSFGPGIPTISISGHTGWRRRSVGDDERDGSERFQRLYDSVWTQWHTLRQDAVKAGNDPDQVRLIFADALDGFAVVVAPTSFVLRRSKTRPLLSQYQIAMTVLSENVDLPDFGVAGVTDNDALEAAGLDSLSASVDSLTDYAQSIQSFIDRTMVAPARDFLIKTIRLYGSTRSAIQSGDEIAGQLIGVARMVSMAGVNIFRTINAVSSVPQQAKTRLMEVAGAYTNIFCVLRNAVRQQQFYPDYNPLFGSSNCSSTSGGRPISPLSGVNPFYLYAPSNRTLPVSINASAQSSLQTMAGTDVVLAPLSQSALLTHLSNISAGMTA
jgi:hypothetical protein